MNPALDARVWLARREPAPSERLLERMQDALSSVDRVHGDLASQLGEAALTCLRATLERPGNRAAALDLLAADALLTYGCEAATFEDADAIERFARDYGAARLGRLLPSQP